MQSGRKITQRAYGNQSNLTWLLVNLIDNKLSSRLNDFRSVWGRQIHITKTISPMNKIGKGC